MTPNREDTVPPTEPSNFGALVEAFLQSLLTTTTSASTQLEEFITKSAKPMAGAANDARDRWDHTEKQREELFERYSSLTSDSADVVLRFAELALDTLQEQDVDTPDRFAEVVRRVAEFITRTTVQAAGGPSGQAAVQPAARTLNIIVDPPYPKRTSLTTTYLVNRSEDAVDAMIVASNLAGEQKTIPARNVKLRPKGELEQNGSPALKTNLKAQSTKAVAVSVALPSSLTAGTYSGVLTVRAGKQESVVVLTLQLN